VRYASWMLLLFTLSISCSAAAGDECNSDNPYLQQTCQSLQQSASETQKASQQETANSIAKHKEEVEKAIQAERKPPPSSAPPKPVLPAWQNALTPPEPAKDEVHALGVSESSSSAGASTEPTSTITPLPPLSPTEFAGPKPVTLPGGVNVIPVKPDKNSGKGTYY
jgi:hypothetical protein